MILSQVSTFCYVLLYFILAGQAVFYKFCFTRVFGAITGLQFVAIRKIADPVLATRLAVVYYTSLALGLLFVILSIFNGGYLGIVCSALSFLMLLVDVFLAKKHNLPINSTINKLVDPTESLSAELQMKWLRWIDIRGSFIIAGFAVLVLWLVFDR